uniref:NADH-ubiquinone oxidoreductase chain 4L n=1 Tax=Coleoptera sp. 17 KM-2017 TaxID=2219320 RepID=A0A346RH74_9COLE|nr:NADH dehydrogenase subunit 4L [Coleoptera sp. 17 KM-2017]
MMIYFSLFMFVMGLISFSLKRKYFLLMLLSLEFIMLSLFMSIYFYISSFSMEFFFLLIFLTFTVCEGVLGLSVLVKLIRNYGNDNFQSFSVLW